MSGAFEVHLTRNAEKDLRQLRGAAQKAVKEILALEDDPDKGHQLNGVLGGIRSLEFTLQGVLTGRPT